MYTVEISLKFTDCSQTLNFKSYSHADEFIKECLFIFNTDIEILTLKKVAQ